jgi:hypothetical protein
MKIKLVKIDKNMGFVTDSDTTTVDLTYKVKKWYYFGREKTVIQRHNVNYSGLDHWVNGLNKVINVWRDSK